MTVLGATYAINAAFDPGFGFEHPLEVVLGGVSTLILAGILGLPIRLVRTLREVWLRQPVLGFIALCGGSLLVVLASVFASEIDVVIDGGIPEKWDQPDTTMTILGWFLTAFGAFHLVTPYIIAPVGNTQDPQGA